ncbi:hypothetical protein SOQ14_13515 [Erythrobacter sp. T5W1-R]|uniref:hypothetical protein n=1 Tax=Erythrobacter sp. T5W1-R TaxID=3101752 RepID=UPI002AFE9716|nr:hypothetical protein [Erythrobacter sp. T5W1-R]MEA1619936.1 hypothetical protein [Erythrobacter sp. T5W1-R]
MKKVCSFILLWSAAAGFCPLAAAQDQPTASARVLKVDDSGTVVLDPVLEMQWQPPGRSGSTSLVSASTRVSVQLNLAAWVGRSGRIYMTLPRAPGPTVRATWKTGGTLLPGTLLSGDRTLVYAGPVTGPVIRDLIEIALEADGARLTQPEALAFGFEIELDQ